MLEQELKNTEKNKIFFLTTYVQNDIIKTKIRETYILLMQILREIMRGNNKNE